MNCGIESQERAKGELKDFPFYLNENKKKKIIFDSNLKSKKELSNFNICKEFNVDSNETLPVGIYKMSFEIKNEQKNQHLTDNSKGILVNGEIKDIYFYKIDVISTNGKTIVITIFEVITNPVPLLFIIYAIGAVGVSLAGGFALTKVSKVISGISANIIKIGASLIVILLGVKVISKW